MLILISQLLNQPILTVDDGEMIGSIHSPIIDPNGGKLAGYYFSSGFFNLKKEVLPVDAILGYEKSTLVVRDHDVALPLKDEPKIRKILQKKLPVLGAKVVTESGKALGKTNDLLLDTELDMIVKYYVHSILNDRIISAEHVVSIEKRGIVVEDSSGAAFGSAISEA
jgi:uncharacterized protein YrrD